MSKVLFLCAIALHCATCHGFVAQPRIIDGLLSDPDDFPFFVNVVPITPQGQAMARCGGAILNERWIVTAAHCLAHDTTVNVHFGVRPNEQYEQTMAIDPAQQLKYPDFFLLPMLFDIGLINLPYAIGFSETIRPAKLPANCDPIPANSTVTVVGNGQTIMYQRSNDTTLRQANLRTLPYKECERMYERTLSPLWLVCAISKGEGKVFFGDSGGPVVRETDGAVVAVSSTVSYGIERINEHAFTQISYYFDWISTKTGLSLPKCNDQAIAYP